VIPQIAQAIQWLADTGIRNTNGNPICAGSINNGYVWRDRVYPYAYSEMTGYGINAFLNMFKWSGDKRYLGYAVDAADYLCRIQCRDRTKSEYGAIPHSYDPQTGRFVREYWSFDNAIVLHGLSDLYRIVKEPSYYTACKHICNWLLNKMQLPDGAFLAYHDAETGVRHHRWRLFHGDAGCLHVKNSIGILSFAQIADSQVGDAARTACEWGVDLQSDDGLFWANQERKYVFTHAHCYATEGYLYAYGQMGEAEFLRICIASGDGLIKLQNRDGSLYSAYKNRLSIRSRLKSVFYPKKTTDATAQAVRIWLILHGLVGRPDYLTAAEKGIAFLGTMQETASADGNAKGGFHYQCWDLLKSRRRSDVLYAWCTAFSLAALYAFHHLDRQDAYGKMIEELF